jgi:hypothetical protein
MLQKNIKILKEKKTPIRQHALFWWNNMNLNEQFHIIEKYNTLLKCNYTRYPDTLTGREIEILFNMIKKNS